MIRTILAAAVLAAGLVSQASAVTTVTVDDFLEHDQELLSAGSTLPSPVMANGLSRKLTLAYGVPPLNSDDTSLYAGPSEAGFSVNSALSVPTATISWVLTAPFATQIPGTGTHVATLNFELTFLQLLSSVDVALKLNATQVGVTQTFTATGPKSFALDTFQNSLSGSTLALVFTGPAGYDAAINNVRFEVSPVPETSTALMLLAGLLATAGMRHRFARRETRI